jgi:probable selenium-dependent hydroxylase accessory protein YqeC
LDFKLPAIVNFVGGGGKTSLILSLLHEAPDEGIVVYTTTTRIHPPHPKGELAIISCDDTRLLCRLLERAARCGGRCASRLVVTRLPMQPDLLRGVPPEFASGLNRDLLPFILNEADGARSMSLKMPRPGEPVLLEGGNYLVPVIGLDCLHKPLGPETLFRWDLAAPRYGLTAGRRVTAELAASLLLHPEGVCRDWKPPTRIIPFINKVDTEGDDGDARELSFALLGNCTFPIERVIWGSVEHRRVGSISACRQ